MSPDVLTDVGALFVCGCPLARQRACSNLWLNCKLTIHSADLPSASLSFYTQFLPLLHKCNQGQFIVASLMSPDVPNFANRGCFVSSFTHSVKLCSFTSCSFNLQFLKPLLRSRLQFIVCGCPLARQRSMSEQGVFRKAPYPLRGLYVRFVQL